ncbi:trypsin-like cysteine/serine peptidase domain-containing protein [Stachybotrys elegans]|uniref:Trypsin-like cysteine/serine peptidase domain-containing protein n=1 Tax=Stachybotrys elegans TaxID=80388 RepID=A0A8K0SI67_9HYPO|nr:trypsin-like cysteine/serine peptidase domain-containing protein [Stachybotrys elegans]
MQIKFALTALASLAAALPQLETSIVGGVAASVGDFPFIVSLSRSGSHFCGGSLLNANTVITAGHCSRGVSASSVSVRAGSLSRTTGGTVVRVSRIVTHPNFIYSTLQNDVSIWKLATPIPTSSTIGYATLAAAGSDPAGGSTSETAGWGTTSSGSGSLPVQLLKVSVPIIARSSCQTMYPDAVFTDMVCAGLPQGGKDSCQGDSGGPLVDSSKTLIGLVSWGYGCAAPNQPGVYARIGALRSFIDANL